MSASPIRVVLIDDHHVLRQGLRQLVDGADGLVVVGEAGDGKAGVALVAEVEPDVVLMDLQMPVLDGVAATAQILADRPVTQVVVLTSFSDGPRIVAALDAGAVGYLLKDSDPDTILEGIRAAHRGESPLNAKAARELLQSRRRQVDPGLTPREREVLILVREGLANKQIARRLGITERTVKAHLGSAFARIGVNDRTQAALWVERHRP